MNDADSKSVAPFAVVVNDDPTQLGILSGLVGKAGLEPRPFKDAEAALADMSTRAGTCLPALIVTDVYMPGIDGWRFTRLLRSPDYAVLNQIPILVVSAIFAGEAPDRIAADLGAEAFFPSPVDGKRFVDKVRAILQGDRRRIPARVLIVEENSAQSGALRKAFKERGYRADAAFTAREAAEAFDRIAYDVAVLNYPLSDGAGDDLLDVFHAQRPNCVFLMTTARGGPEEALEWMKRGAAACLYKPFDPEYLIELCTRTRRERSLLRVQELLETRTRELRESEERYRRLAEDMPMFITVSLPDGTLAYVNETLARWKSVSPADLIGKNFYDFLLPEDRETVRTLLNAVTPEKSVETHMERCPLPDGSLAWLEWTNRAFFDERDRLTHFQSTGTDITLRKQTEDALQKSEQLLNSAQRLARIGGWQWDLATQAMTWSDEAYRIHDLAPQEFAPGSADLLTASLACYGPEDRLVILKAFQRCVEQGEPYDLEFPFTTAKGRRLWIRTSAEAVQEGGRVVRVVGNFMDITERKQWEKALRESEERYRNIFNDSIAGIFQTTPEGRFRMVNPAFARIFGYDSAEEMGALTGSPKLIFADPEDRKKSLALLNASQGILRDFDAKMRRRDGSCIWVSFNARMIYESDGSAAWIEGTCIDITQRKQADDALIYRLACEHCTAECIGILAESGDLQDRLDRILEKLQSVTKAGRAYIFENEDDPDVGLCATQIAEFCAKGVESQFENPDLQHLPYGPNFSSLLSVLQTRKPFSGIVSEMTAAERNILEPQGILSVLILPVFTGNALWGFIGFDDCATQRQWREEDVQILKTVADAAGAAILRDQTTEALRESEERHRVLLNGLPDFVIRYDRDGRHLFVSNNIRNLSGIEADQYIGRTRREMGFPEAHCRFQEERIQRVFDTGAPLETEFTFEGKQGQMIFDWRLIPEFDAKGAVSSVLSTTRDITKHRRMEREYQILFHEMLDGFALHEIMRDQAGNPVGYRFLAVNPAFERMTGLKGSQINGRCIHEVLPGRHPCFENFDKAAQTGKPVFFQSYVPELGKHFDVTVLMPSPGQILCILTDITERRQAEEALKQSHKRLETALNSMDAHVYIADMQTYELLFTNEYGRKIWGDTGGRKCWQALQKGQNGPCPFCTNDKLLTADSRPAGVYTWEFQNTVNGRWYECRDRAIEWTDGRLVRMEIATDITERKQAEEALRQFKTVFDAANFGMAISDLNGVLIYINECFAAAHGYEAADLIGQPLMRLHNEEQRDQVERLLRQIVNGNTFEAQEVRHCHRDGTPFPMLMTGTLVRNAEGAPKYFASTAIDLSERKILEAQLAQAQKMESVGRLAGGVAHDFNNMLSVILGYADMALNSADTAHPLYHALTQIRDAAVRSSDLTRQLLAFARRQTIAPSVLDLNETVAGTLKMIRRLIGEDIDLAWRPMPETWPVLMDPSQIDQILANLCVNARDAIAGVGRINIETENIALDEAYCKDHVGFVPGDYVMLAVSDDGAGMDPETMSHLFEPFFTTKKPGEGTGLGLATIYGAVKQNNGFINVYSEPGKGSTFRIYLPRHAGDKGRKQAEEAELPTLKGRETILLVEDEPMILELAVTILETQDYTVIAANTPGEAIRLAREHAGKIHLLLTDVIMPEMNGRELAKKLLSLYPDMKRLFMSGYTADVIAHHGVLEEGVNFISKPFSVKDLTAKVRQALDNGERKTY